MEPINKVPKDEYLRNKILATHVEEEQFMKMNSILDKKIHECRFEKAKIASRVSKLVLYRNRLINKL